MVKEELMVRIARYISVGSINHFEDDICEFFSQNICIPKGDNRHPDADAVHEWLEDTSKKLQYHREGKWYTDYPFGIATRYRIKPLEPQYEWQWEYPSNDISLITPDYMTVEEVEKVGIKLWCKTETKRIRK